MTGSVMSQPFADMAIEDTGTTPCAISGYPRIGVRGVRAEDRDSSARPLPISVHHGLYERKDPGPLRLVLRPGHPLFFSVGTATAFQGGVHLLRLTRLVVVLPGTRVPRTIRIDLLASRPAGRRIPVGLTAITPSPHP
jgi:hypothetical protein